MGSCPRQGRKDAWASAHEHASYARASLRGLQSENTCTFILVRYGLIFMFLLRKGKIVVFNQGEILFMGE